MKAHLVLVLVRKEDYFHSVFWIQEQETLQKITGIDLRRVMGCSPSQTSPSILVEQCSTPRSRPKLSAKGQLFKEYGEDIFQSEQSLQVTTIKSLSTLLLFISLGLFELFNILAKPLETFQIMLYLSERAFFISIGIILVVILTNEYMK
ncbi:hypothetical protein TNIN_238451 [Trichonephila inaurata madagascariensis]|uniref:Uncharacterized protein n=1 Tax=Trichonephila inaurata madagascariensis TaxID=2747483 RepID=A0A8X7CSD0_9ARAC|nr:hypothetical protein TNIN_238451 [Trichonephila inaurata madagascariensis]